MDGLQSEECVHVEVVQKSQSTVDRAVIMRMARDFLEQEKTVSTGSFFEREVLSRDEDLCRHVESIRICSDGESKAISTEEVTLDLYVFQLHEDCSGSDVIGMENDDCEMRIARRWRLPSKQLFGLWELLEFESNIKDDALNFIANSLNYADHGVSNKIIEINKVILLHGPPGTGKTSLCRALAQKLSIRFQTRYPRSQLIEIDSHSLFSKWFSESGKLVSKAFESIAESVEDKDCFVCVLVDEVESLVRARKAAMNGSEPSDAIRAVNSVLTQLDRLKEYPNVLILTTSNITGAIDMAFVDRADLKLFIGLPPIKVIYKIYFSIIVELVQKNIITPPKKIVEYEMLELCDFRVNDLTKDAMEILELAKLSVSMSGRTLRKIPFLAHTLYVKSANLNFEQFINAMKLMIARYFKNIEEFS